MSRGKALEKLELNTRQESILKSYLDKRTASKHYLRRINIILLAHQGLSNMKIAEVLSTTQNTVRKWRARWLTGYEELCTYEQEKTRSTPKLLTKMLGMLSDDSRSGAPMRISLSEKENLVALACKKPQDFNIPFTHWNRDLLASFAMENGIVKKISPSYVSQVLKKSGHTSS